MNILVPLNNLEHLSDYINAGAKEYYIGFYDQKWHDKFGEYADINRLSGFHQSANPYSFEEVIELIPKIKEKGVKIYITFNASIYNEAQLGYIRSFFEKLTQAGSDGVIISCIELAHMANEYGLSCVASTICGIYNSDMAKEYAKAGVKRLILPRDLNQEEIIDITKRVPEVEYEVFMMRNGCVFSDSNCLGFHRLETCAICSSIGQSKHNLYLRNIDFDSLNKVELTDSIYTDYFHKHACGMCSIYDFLQAGISALKIVGRSDDWEYVCKDIGYVAKNIEIAKESSSREEYLENMVFPEDRNIMCKLGLSCYYPEVRFS